MNKTLVRLLVATFVVAYLFALVISSAHLKNVYALYDQNEMLAWGLAISLEFTAFLISITSTYMSKHISTIGKVGGYFALALVWFGNYYSMLLSAPQQNPFITLAFSSFVGISTFITGKIIGDLLKYLNTENDSAPVRTTHNVQTEQPALATPQNQQAPQTPPSPAQPQLPHSPSVEPEHLNSETVSPIHVTTTPHESAQAPAKPSPQSPVASTVERNSEQHQPIKQEPTPQNLENTAPVAPKEPTSVIIQNPTVPETQPSRKPEKDLNDLIDLKPASTPPASIKIQEKTTQHRTMSAAHPRIHPAPRTTHLNPPSTESNIRDAVERTEQTLERNLTENALPEPKTPIAEKNPMIQEIHQFLKSTGVPLQLDLIASQFPGIAQKEMRQLLEQMQNQHIIHKHEEGWTAV